MTNDSPFPNRLHHTAYVTADLEATRLFYEEIIGLPLVATWCEKDELFGAERTYCHCFFGLSDGSALAFFQFADASDQALFGPKIPSSPFHHIALNCDTQTQKGIQQRLEAGGYGEAHTYLLQHGYCTSLYVRAPEGMLLEFTVDEEHATSEQAIRERRTTAHTELKRWLAGDHSSNNNFHR